tara:strand:- start:95 stop:523 length:429 start_codon:yes stop_codon:yes gene_type:complete
MAEIPKLTKVGIVKAIGKGAVNAFKKLDDIGIADKYSVSQLQKFFNSLKGIKEPGVGTIRKKIKDAREFSMGRADASADSTDMLMRKKGGNITKRPMGGKVYKVTKKPMGGKVYKNTVARKHGGAIGTGTALRGFGKGYKKG